MSFESLGLRAELLRAVAQKGYTVPTPIQRETIPIILRGRDVMAGAQTGTGKTAGFALPLLQRLSEQRLNGRRGAGRRRPVRALILTPTRELAAQVEQSVRSYGRGLPLNSTVIFGGVGINPQIDALRRGVDIVVATPGRLLDHVGQRTIDLSSVEIFVLDEADRMLDMGFVRDIRRVIDLLPRERQNLLFSATTSDEIIELANELLNSPEQIQVARRNTPAELVDQVVHLVDRNRKRELLSHLIASGDWVRTLVFTRTRHGADRLCRQLIRDGLDAAAIHGDKAQGARTKALARFKKGSLRVLVATDLAARGLDIEQLPHVVNFELPNVPEDYVHRIGRTGRAGNEGQAVSLVCVDEMEFLRDIERLLRRDLPTVVIPGFEPDPLIMAQPVFKSRPPGPSRTQRTTARRPRGFADGSARGSKRRRSGRVASSGSRRR